MMPEVLIHEALSWREKYARELDDLLAQVDQLEAQSVRRAMALLADARHSILDTLAAVQDASYLAGFLPRLLNEVESSMATYVRRYGQSFETDVTKAWELGHAAVDQPLASAGISVMVDIPSLAPAYLDILQGFRAGLITGVSDVAIQRITTELQLGVLGGKTPYQMQQGVREILRTQANAEGSFGTVAARAEAITRTELNRTFSLSYQARSEAAAARITAVFPDAVPRKQWINSGDARVRPAHARQSLLDQRPKISEDFVLTDVGGATYRAKGPHDARLPASLAVGCRCRSVTAVDSLLSILDEEPS